MSTHNLSGIASFQMITRISVGTLFQQVNVDSSTIGITTGAGFGFGSGFGLNFYINESQRGVLDSKSCSRCLPCHA